LSYHVSGIIAAILAVFALSGLVVQIRLIWQRKRLTDAGELLNERPTAVLSVNRFMTSFLAWYCFMIYGATMQRFNHYLVWPRAAAVVLTLTVMFELMIDRRQKRVTGAFILCAALAAAGFALVIIRPPITPMSRHASQAFVCFVTVIFAQGGIAQLRSIRRSGRTGGLSLAMHQLFFVKDLGTAIFALSMGLADGWPVLLLSGSAMAVQGATIWHFRWIQSEMRRAGFSRHGTSSHAG
jgi:uncharacterized protein with PQ loop repeat